MSFDAYTRSLLQLLPLGRALPREAGTSLEKLAAGLADELRRIDGRVVDLIAELPATTTELIDEWESALGLPDECAPESGTNEARRDAIVARLNETADNSPQGFVDILAAFGYLASVEEFDPFPVGLGGVGDSISGAQWQFVWRVNVAASVEIDNFRAGVNRAGDRLTDFGVDSVECLINRLKPAHTLALFAYTESQFLLEGGGNLLTESGEPLIFEENVT